MRMLRLMADYDCSPLWEPGAEHYNVDPIDLAVSQLLRDDLWAWAARYDETLDRDDPGGGSRFPGADAPVGWLSTGARLATQLRQELGPEAFEVEYYHESTDPTTLWMDV